MATEEQAQAAKRELGMYLPSPLRDHHAVLMHVPWKHITVGGLLVEHNETLPPIFGVVLLVGDKVRDVKYADHVRFRRHSGEHFTHQNRDLFLIHIDDIECVIEPEELEEAEDFLDD